MLRLVVDGCRMVGLAINGWMSMAVVDEEGLTVISGCLMIVVTIGEATMVRLGLSQEPGCKGNLSI